MSSAPCGAHLADEGKGRLKRGAVRGHRLRRVRRKRAGDTAARPPTQRPESGTARAQLRHQRQRIYADRRFLKSPVGTERRIGALSTRDALRCGAKLAGLRFPPSRRFKRQGNGGHRRTGLACLAHRARHGQQRRRGRNASKVVERVGRKQTATRSACARVRGGLRGGDHCINLRFGGQRVHRAREIKRRARQWSGGKLLKACHRAVGRLPAGAHRGGGVAQRGEFGAFAAWRRHVCRSRRVVEPVERVLHLRHKLGAPAALRMQVEHPRPKPGLLKPARHHVQGHLFLGNKEDAQSARHRVRHQVSNRLALTRSGRTLQHKRPPRARSKHRRKLTAVARKRKRQLHGVLRFKHNAVQRRRSGAPLEHRPHHRMRCDLCAPVADIRPERPLAEIKAGHVRFFMHLPTGKRGDPCTHAVKDLPNVDPRVVLWQFK